MKNVQRPHLGKTSGLTRTQLRHASAMHKLVESIQAVSRSKTPSGETSGGRQQTGNGNETESSRLRVDANGTVPIYPNEVSRGTLLRDRLRKRQIHVMADSVSLEDLETPGLYGSVLRPGNILEHLDDSEIYYHLWVAVSLIMDKASDCNIETITKLALEQLIVELGAAIIDRVDGPHCTFINSKLDNANSIMEQSLSLLGKFKDKGVDREKIVISIPATENGVRAAKRLKTEYSIQTNLTCISGLIHAAACVDAGASAITISVGQVLGWHEAKRKKSYSELSPHVGVETIQSIVAYLRHHHLEIEVVGVDFRQLRELQALHCFDSVCLSREQLEKMRSSRLGLTMDRDIQSTSLLRARQAQYPPSVPESGAFTSAMSAETRSAAAAAVYVGSTGFQRQLALLEGKVRELVEARVKIASMSVKEVLQVSMDRESQERGGKSSKGVRFPGTVEIQAKSLVEPEEDTEVF